MVLKLYSISGESKLEFTADGNARQEKSVMGQNFVSFSFTLYEYIPLAFGDWIEVFGEKYILMEDYLPNKISTIEYQYNINLKGAEEFLKVTKIPQPHAEELDFEFYYDAGPLEHLKLIVDNLNRTSPVKDWVIGEVIEGVNKNIYYNNKFCYDALIDLANEYGTEFWIEGKTINLSRCEFGDSIVLGYASGLVSLSKSENTEVPTFTRLYPIGSKRNIVKDKYGYSRLQLSSREQYVERNTHLGVYEQSEELRFNHIYPRRYGKVTSVREELAKNSEGQSFTIYYIKDSSLNFDFNDYKIQGLVKHIVFNSGELNGRDFEFKFNSRTKEIEIINQYPNDSTQLPGYPLIPQDGDEYVTYNHIMPDEYYKLAEKEYEQEVNLYLKEISEDTAVYKGHTDYVFLDENKAYIRLGQRVLLTDDRYFTSNRPSRVTRIVRSILRPNDMDLEFCYAVTRGRITKLESTVNNVETLYKEELGKKHLQVLKSWDNSDPTEYNVLSSKRSINSFHHKDRTDETDYLQKYNKGAEFGQYGKKKGAYINEEGIGDFEKVVSKDTDFKEMHSDSATMDVATINELITKLAKIHKLEVTDTATILKSVVKEYLTSEKFVSGFAGEGFRIAQAINGDWNLEIDNLIVRKLFNVFELLVQEIKHQGGMQLYSPAGGKITKVTDVGSYWKCEIDGADIFFKDDLVICQKFTGTIKRYWRAVTSVGAGYINLSKNDCETNSAIPEVGDEIAVQGNKTNTSRQSVYIVSVVGADSPYTAYYSGINSYSLKDKLVTREGNLNGIIDKDFGQLKGFGLYANNAYLKGILRLTNGKTVEQELLSTNNTVEANRLQLGGEIDKAKADAKVANDKIDNLQIGGVNLALDSEKEYKPTSSTDFTKGTNPISVTHEETLAISFDIKADSSRRIQSVIVQWYKDKPTTHSQGSNRLGFQYLYDDVDVSYYRKKHTFTLPSDENINWVIVGYRDTSSINATIRKIKVERGNKPTDWSPAPEDLDAELVKQITNVRTDFDVIEGQINANVAKTETLVNQTSGLVEETKQTASQVNQTATEINQNVSRAEESATRAETAETNINIKADGIVMEASKQSAEKAIDGLVIGGENIIKNSKVLKRVGEAGGIKKTQNEVGVYGYSVEKINGNWANVYFEMDKSSYAEFNIEYTLSFDIYYSGDVKIPIPPTFYIVNLPYSKISGVLKKEEWCRMYITFIPKSSSYWNPHFGFKKCEGQYFFKNLKAEKGNKATDWSPALEDIDSQFQATNSKLELLNNQFTVEVSKTDGTQKELTDLKIDHNEFKVQVKTDIDGAIDTNNEVIKSEFVVNEKGLGFRGNEIDMTGRVTYTSLNAEAQGKIDDAKRTADNAAQDIWDLRTEVGDLAYEDMVSLAKLDNTIIEGGYIKTSLIEANSITADKINVQSLESVRIRTGNLDVLAGATIAGFKVAGTGLTNEGFNNDAYIVIRNDPKKVFTAIGANVHPATSSFVGNARFEIETPRSLYDINYNVALNLKASGCERRDRNIAINIEGGSISGFGLTVERWSASDTMLTTNASFILDYTTGHRTKYIPSPGETWVGRVLFFKNINTGWLQIRAKYKNGVINTDKCFQWGDGDRGDSKWSLDNGQVGMLINEGTQWYCSYLDWQSKQW